MEVGCQRMCASGNAVNVRVGASAHETYATRVIAENGEHEVEIRRSRFRCTVARVSDVDTASAAVARVRRAWPDAQHHCWAMRIGQPDTGFAVQGDDDGEPAGTAGTPMLAVLAQRGLLDVVTVVSRWFGGTKLGAGGLVRAYSGTLAETLDMVGALRRVPHRELLVAVSHERAGRLEHDLRHSGYTLRDVDYGTDVSMTVAVTEPDVAEFREWLAARCGEAVDVIDTGACQLYLP